MEVSDELKSDKTTDIKTTSLDSSVTDDVTAVADTNDVDMKTEEGTDGDSVPQEPVSTDDNSSNYQSSEPASKKKKVKRVSWVDESKLCSYFYFQLDETERVNVNRSKDFAETRKHEQEMERQVMQNVRRMAHDTMTEKQDWTKPRLITGLTVATVPGCNSKERDTQREREQSVLFVLYFNKSSIPDSAAEPEPEYFEFTEPRVIPLQDETGLGISYDTGVTTSVPQTSTQLPPAIANLLASTAPQPANTPVTSAGPTTVSVTASSNSGPLLPQPQSAPGAQFNIPPLPVFLGMPLPMQQQIFQSVPVHIQQQMLSSLPPPLQNQLGPLMGSTAPNCTPPFPDGDMAAAGRMPPMARPRGPPPNFARRPVGRPPFVGAPDTTRPQRPPHVGRLRGATPQSGRTCKHFLAGHCRYGASCRNVHPPRDVGSAAAAVSPPQQESPR